MHLYQRFRYLPMFLGLRLYTHLHGYPTPEHDFVVPDAPQWPYWMAGMPLGEWAAAARIQQEMITTHYRDRRRLLDAMEMPWWLPPGRVDRKYFQALDNPIPLPDTHDSSRSLIGTNRDHSDKEATSNVESGPVDL